MFYKVETNIHFGKPPEKPKQKTEEPVIDDLIDIDNILKNKKLTCFQKDYIIKKILPQIRQEIKHRLFENSTSKSIVINKTIKIPPDNRLYRINISLSL